MSRILLFVIVAGILPSCTQVLDLDPRASHYPVWRNLPLSHHAEFVLSYPYRHFSNR